MKKLALAVALVLLTGFIMITLFRQTTNDQFEVDKTKDTLTTNAKSEIDDFWAAYNKGDRLFRAGEHARSVDHFLRALRFDSTHENTWYRLGNAYAETGRYDKALHSFERLININPMSSRAHRRAGQLLSEPRPGAPADHEQAKFHFEQAQQLNREQSGPHYSMGRLLVTQGESKTGSELLQNAAATNPKFAEAFRLLGYTDLIEARYARAHSGYLRALRAGGVDNAPDAQPGEGDTKASMSQQGPYANKNIASLYGMAVAARANDGYPDDVPENCRITLGEPDTQFVSASATWTPKTPTPTSTAWADMDSDGAPELITIGPSSPLQIWSVESDSRFTDISATFGLAGNVLGSGLFAVDFNSDNDTDIFVLVGDRFGLRRLMLLRNDSGRLIDASDATGLSQLPKIAALAFAGFERDNPPDLVVLAEAKGERFELLLYSVLDGYFQKESSNLLAGMGWPTDIAVGDYDNDGYLDLFITRWKQPPLLMRNVEGQSFRDVTEQSGVGAHPLSLAATFLDFNHDGHLDLFVSAMAPYEDALRSVMDRPSSSNENRPTLYLNRGDGSFESIPFDSALGHHFGTLGMRAGDFNSDGYTDIYLTNGGFAYDRFEPDALLLNRAGKYFECYYAETSPGKSLAVSSRLAMDNVHPLLVITRGGFHPGQPATKPNVVYIK